MIETIFTFPWVALLVMLGLAELYEGHVLNFVLCTTACTCLTYCAYISIVSFFDQKPQTITCAASAVTTGSFLILFYLMQPLQKAKEVDTFNAILLSGSGMMTILYLIFLLIQQPQVTFPIIGTIKQEHHEK